MILDDHVIIGGLTPVHQFVHIGACSMIGGGSVLVKDVPPFMMTQGNHAFLVNINKVGMERNGYSQEEIEDAFRAFKVFRKPHTFEHLPEYLENDLTKEGRVLKLTLEYLASLKVGAMRGLVTGER